MEQPMTAAQLQETLTEFDEALNNPDLTEGERQDIVDALEVLNQTYSGDFPILEEGQVDINSRAPEVSFAERALVKNLGASDPQALATQVQRLRPDLDVAIAGENREIAVRKKGSREPYQVIDPAGLDLEDVTDIAYDIPAGIAQGVATAAGAGLGLPTGPGTALLGGMAASAGSGAALQGLKDQLARLTPLGLSDSAASDALLAGGVGAATPLAFGVPGARGALGVVRDAIGKGLRWGGRQALKGASSVKGEAIETMLRSADLADRINAPGDPLRRQAIKGIRQNLVGKAKANRDQAWAANRSTAENYNSLTQGFNLGSRRGEPGLDRVVDLRPAKQAFWDNINQLERRAADVGGPRATNRIDQGQINQLKRTYRRIFTSDNVRGSSEGYGPRTMSQVEVPDAATPREATAILERLNSITDWQGTDSPVVRAMRDAVTRTEDALDARGFLPPKDSEYFPAQEALKTIRDNLRNVSKGSKFVRSIGDKGGPEELLQDAGMSTPGPMASGWGKIFRAAEAFNPRTQNYNEGARFGMRSVQLAPRTTRQFIDTARAIDGEKPIAELEHFWRQKVPAALARTPLRIEKKIRRTQPGLWLPQLLNWQAQGTLDETSESPMLRGGL